MGVERRGQRLSMGRLSRRGLCLVAVLATVEGCQSTACPTSLHTDPKALIDQHESVGRSFDALRVEARVEQWGKKGRIRGTVWMLLERPDRVRFDVMTQLGPVSILTSDGEQFQLLDLRENRFIEGPTCAENIAGLIGISLDAEDVLKLLTGEAPRIAAATESMECRGGEYVVNRTAPDGTRQEIALSVPRDLREAPLGEQRFRLSRAEVFAPSGKTKWRVTYDDYEKVPGARPEQELPRTIRFVDKSHGVDTRIRVKSLTIGPNIPGDAFVQRAPNGVVREFSACP